MCVGRVCALLLLLSPISATRAEPTLEDRIAATATQQGFEEPNVDELATVEVLFDDLLAGHDVTIDLTELGWKVERLDGSIILIREAEDRREGRGVYLVRQSTETRADIMIQAPHRFTDVETERIALQLFQTFPDVGAAALNTVPRSYETRWRRIDADVAHLPDSYFVGFSRAFARRRPAGRIVQLHGFDSTQTGHGPAVARSDVIVSSATWLPSLQTQAFHGCLRAAWPARSISLYPWHVGELGGIRNAVGRALRMIGFDGFLYLQLSMDVRKTLRDDADAREEVIACLQ